MDVIRTFGLFDWHGTLWNTGVGFMVPEPVPSDGPPPQARSSCRARERETGPTLAPRATCVVPGPLHQHAPPPHSTPPPFSHLLMGYWTENGVVMPTIFHTAVGRQGLEQRLPRRRPESEISVPVSSHESAAFRGGGGNFCGRVARLATRQGLLDLSSPTHHLHLYNMARWRELGFVALVEWILD